MIFIRKSVYTLLALFLVSSQAWGERRVLPLDELEPTQQHRQSTMIILKVIDKYHYKKAKLDDEMSGQLLDRYLDSLDPNRSFFTAKDIEGISLYQDKLDNYLLNARLEPAFAIFRIYRKRVDEAVETALKLVDTGFDFSIDEVYQFDREDAPWAQTRTELEDIWRKRVKNDFLNLRLTGKEDDEIRKTLKERYEGLQRRISQFDSNDIYQAFINAYTLSLEPHTSYMSPSTSENFDISMRLSLEGIGAVLRMDDEFTVVQKTVAGGPAKFSGDVHAGDRIVGVGQGLEGDILDIIGWRLQDVVEKIRGPKGTVVRLRILPKDAGSGGKTQLVTLVRNKIKLEEQAAKSSVIEGLEGMGKLRIGVIEVPTFYRDFAAEGRGDESFRSTTRDVRKLVTELKKTAVDGVVIDLRQNGGGSLSEATELTGIFIDTGPVVQIKDAFGKVEVERDPDTGIAYDGPLAVLVDRNSASASEIFAGAIQDYQRGIVIGEPTFGKGTVQTLVDLGRFVPSNEDDLGRLRLTMAQFFRINGGSTQHRGVVPDILFPMASYSAKHGERSLDNALPWAQIKAARYAPKGGNAVSHLLDRHKGRISKDAGFQMLLEQEKRIQEIEDRTEITLLESQRKLEWDQREKARMDHKNRFRIASGMASIKTDRDREDHDDEADKVESEAASLIQLNETARILADSIHLQAPRAVMR
ncbi:MAG: peptidase S41 [Gammaproteobacteria bacterium (ex Lamellibrachia satsuma)]|nr:MAG: carboxy terminal-processing peptidase [Gammaproteobacteria bacterium (ex Lamellibrachia satsuma)]RRS34771.1 MAG: peptidase S41 [Gammaproteobacteria bacterium (ex Lamellibrachia satsuma)]RRS34852.1 MAG: peptidase S41 [Gammaproteobacteria bacterium (ex Lamellibrachia satsuma)]